MKKKTSFFIALSSILAFVIWTLLVRFVGVNKIGPNNSSVGLSSLNSAFHSLTGVNWTLYAITDWLGLVPITVALCFALLGLVQWIGRKRITKVDFNILSLGVFYIVVFSLYVIFEYLVINYRPTLINGYLEPSYPSSTTMLVLCVMPTTIMQLHPHIKTRQIKITLTITITFFALFMVIGRLLSGVHWLSDIIGGALLSNGLVFLYYSFYKR